MTECLKNAASDAVTRRTGTVKAVIETVFRRHQLPCTVRPLYALRGGVPGARGGSLESRRARDARSETFVGHGGGCVRGARGIGERR